MDQSTTSSLEHTAGPWHAEEAPSASSMRSIRTAPGKVIAFVNRGPDAAANERLIIAAPELLEALIDLKEAVDVIATEQCESGEAELIEWWNRHTGAGWQAAVKADKAITRAEGRTP